MEKVKVIGFVQEAWKVFQSAAFEINGVSLQVAFWDSEDFSQYGMDVLESMDDSVELIGLEEINHDEPIFCCILPDGMQLITNSVEDIIEQCAALSPSHDQGIDSFKLLDVNDVRPEPMYSKLWHQVESGEIEVPEFNFYYSFDEMKWAIPTGICALAGCDTKLLYFDSEQEAYDHAVKLTQDGQEPKIGEPCAACSAEYYD
ncbi:hypothetical protein J7E73_10430 [Paenibacillus albidus]|uniref:hypothetical protein n=1 Tax=Paenibacillus albidus TaxID=2041023 RepID=UPI001BE4F35E|nr:hypothetical protein [Paenibacillus albidus]MBT2289542.1 hypothetical protein [Paenibacillus albidus]